MALEAYALCKANPSAISMGASPLVWTTTGDSDGSYTTPASASAKYFRVHGP